MTFYIYLSPYFKQMYEMRLDECRYNAEINFISESNI